MKSLVITGGSTGIGAATSRVFLAAGWQVTSLARRPSPVPGVRSIAVDFSVAGWDEHFEREVVPSFTHGTLCLVHNAALLEKDSALALSAAQLRHVLEVNVVAPGVLNRLLRPAMAPGSSIIYVGSTLSEKAVANTASYVVSKHALVGLMRATCQDAVGMGIHTACVCPGFVDTEMLRAHVSASGGGQRALESMSSHHRLIKPEEIGELLLACANQPVLDGAVLHANLGQIER